MRKPLNKLLIVLASLCFIPAIGDAQVFTNKEVGKKNLELADSLKHSEYPYSLPIWGAKATKAGYNLPYSAGVSVNYLGQESDLIIENLQVGFNNGPLYNLDEFLKFDKAVSRASALTFRPDVWVFPFLNVYAIIGKSVASTNVGFGLYLPDSTDTPKKVAGAESKVDFNATTAGFGITPTIGIGGGFLALDMSCTWTDVPQLKKPAFAFVFGPRLGKNIKLKHPGETIALWVGGFRLKLNSGTDGSVNLGEVLPINELNQKVDDAMLKVDNSQQQVDAWWNNLSSTEQKNPVNVAKYNSANSILERAGQFLNSAEQAVNNASTSTVQYKMDKRPKDMWNFLIGSQYQLDKHWMVRGEVGFLTSRTQVLVGIQYRFGL